MELSLTWEIPTDALDRHRSRLREKRERSGERQDDSNVREIGDTMAMLTNELRERLGASLLSAQYFPGASKMNITFTLAPGVVRDVAAFGVDNDLEPITFWRKKDAGRVPEAKPAQATDAA